jgi:hypothetical protein
MFGFKMKLGLGNKVLLPEYGQKRVLDLEQFVSSNLNTCTQNVNTFGPIISCKYDKIIIEMESALLRRKTLIFADTKFQYVPLTKKYVQDCPYLS